MLDVNRNAAGEAVHVTDKSLEKDKRPLQLWAGTDALDLMRQRTGWMEMASDAIPDR